MLNLVQIDCLPSRCKKGEKNILSDFDLWVLVTMFGAIQINATSFYLANRIGENKK